MHVHDDARKDPQKRQEQYFSIDGGTGVAFRYELIHFTSTGLLASVLTQNQPQALDESRK